MPELVQHSRLMHRYYSSSQDANIHYHTDWHVLSVYADSFYGELVMISMLFSYVNDKD